MSRFAVARLLVVCAIALMAGGIERAGALESTLDRIARTGVLTAGTRDDAPPFAFRDGQGRLTGLSVDLIEEVRKGLARKLARDVRTEYVVVTSQTRLTAIEEGKADLVCETATVTWSREQRVDFTLPIFRDGTRILAYRDTIDWTQDLHNLRIGIVEGSVTGRVIREKLPDIALTPYPTMQAALRGLEAAEVDGIANIGIVLRGLLPLASKPQGLVIVPRGEALGYETMACLLPENDSRWRDFVNGVFRELFRGIEAYRGGYADMYDRWFGRNAEIAYPLDERSVQFFMSTLIWLD